ncbi:xanthine dehydrogenase family protein subunit M (plasmid) [Agrobacterium sp. 33MFTa1.1]|uniref:FAD binding domain-containing protein n=1 Tax=Agrobacterium sp. 33MFTa1.1 TaxID=1279031 RepID=UPI0005559F8D|nr:xanthine dehydrogenase family protein subunit M [Agrobacterium sp. 33MFTa1.1]QBJ16506.1 xanthine dehydrogenase family protein subunit M [Agrobacterium sp. 33MFTa1.1]
MRPFTLLHAEDLSDAVEIVTGVESARFIAGGTTLVDLMKLGVEEPEHIININDVQGLNRVHVEDDGSLHIGALARMSDVADDQKVQKDWPALSESLWKGASAQLRNMASIGGNLLQRTRCPYFRDTAFQRCNKRAPGSGCDAMEGHNRENALLGTSPHCIALHPSDLCVSLAAFDARIETLSASGSRVIEFADLHLIPGDTPQLENCLRPGEMITAVIVPASSAARRSLYLKVRDRQSYQFAVTSVAAAVELCGDGRIRDVRLALGGVATKPWRAREAERYLIGRRIDEPTALEAGRLAMSGAEPRRDNAFKIALMQRTIVDALLQLLRLEVA